MASTLSNIRGELVSNRFRSARTSVLVLMYLVFSVAYLYAYSYVLVEPAFKLYSAVRLAFGVLLFSKCFDHFIATPLYGPVGVPRHIMNPREQ